MFDALEEQAQIRLAPQAPTQELPMWIWGVTAFVAAYTIMQVQGLG